MGRKLSMTESLGCITLTLAFPAVPDTGAISCNNSGSKQCYIRHSHSLQYDLSRSQFRLH